MVGCQADLASAVDIAAHTLQESLKQCSLSLLFTLSLLFWQPVGHVYRFQLRCLLDTPIHAQPGSKIEGELRLVAHNRQSYDVFVSLTGPPLHPGQLPQQVSLHTAHHTLTRSHKESACSTLVATLNVTCGSCSPQ